MELAVDMISDLRASGLIDGIHLSTLNLERSSRLILERLKLAPSKKEQPKVCIVVGYHSILVTHSMTFEESCLGCLGK